MVKEIAAETVLVGAKNEIVLPIEIRNAPKRSNPKIEDMARRISPPPFAMINRGNRVRATSEIAKRVRIARKRQTVFKAVEYREVSAAGSASFLSFFIVIMGIDKRNR